MIAIGVLVALGSLFMETSAPVDIPATSLYGLSTPSSVYNLGLLQDQLLVFVAGCSLAVAGAAVAAAGAVADRISPDVTPAEPASLVPDATPEPTVMVGPVPPDPEPLDQARADSDMYVVIGIVTAALFLLLVFAMASGGSAGKQPVVDTDINLAMPTTDNMTP